MEFLPHNLLRKKLPRERGEKILRDFEASSGSVIAKNVRNVEKKMISDDRLRCKKSNINRFLLDLENKPFTRKRVVNKVSTEKFCDRFERLLCNDKLAQMHTN